MAKTATQPTPQGVPAAASMPATKDGRQPVIRDVSEVIQFDLGEKIPMLCFDRPPKGREKLVESLRLKLSSKRGWDKEAVRTVALSLYLGRSLKMVGPQGCGKTSLLTTLLTLGNWDWRVIGGNAYAEPLDLMGTQVPVENGGTEFVLGAVADCYESDKALVINEVDCYNPMTVTALHDVLDRYPLELPFRRGEPILPSNYFRALATANTAANGEGIETFTAAQVHAASSNRRWWVYTMDYLSKDEEARIVREQFPAARKEVVDRMVEFAQATRDLAKEKRGYAMCHDEVLGFFEVMSLVRPESAAKFAPLAIGLTYFNKLTIAQRAAAEEKWKDLLLDKLGQAGDPK